MEKLIRMKQKVYFIMSLPSVNTHPTWIPIDLRLHEQGQRAKYLFLIKDRDTRKYSIFASYGLT